MGGAIGRRARRLLNALRRDAVHLFLLSPPASGSTAFQRLIETSPSVTSFPVEGQWLPGAREEIGLPGRRWNEDLRVDWSRVRDAFLSHWSP